MKETGVLAGLGLPRVFSQRQYWWRQDTRRFLPQKPQTKHCTLYNNITCTFLRPGDVFELSEQQLVNCDTVNQASNRQLQDTGFAFAEKKTAMINDASPSPNCTSTLKTKCRGIHNTEQCYRQSEAQQRHTCEGCLGIFECYRHLPCRQYMNDFFLHVQLNLAHVVLTLSTCIGRLSSCIFGSRSCGS